MTSLSFLCERCVKAIRQQKKTTLSLTARLNDPLVLICPVVTKDKILIKQTWLLKLEWDDPIPNNLQQK